MKSELKSVNVLIVQYSTSKIMIHIYTQVAIERYTYNVYTYLYIYIMIHMTIYREREDLYT